MLSLRLQVTCAALAGLLTLSPVAARGGANWGAKVAVHVLAHDDLRTCTRDFPEITDCQGISTTWAGCGSIDIFPVFYDMVECRGVEYGLAWPGSGTCTFQPCSDLHIGEIVNSGDGISQVWFVCGVEPAVIPGFAWIDLAQPARICVVPHPQTGIINILDCDDQLDQPVAAFCAGVCGSPGDDPCETVFLPLGLAKSDGTGGACVCAGDSIGYLISYDNDRNLEEVHGVTLTDSLPSEVEFLSCSGGGAYDALSHKVTWNLGSLQGGDSGTEEVRVMVGDFAPPGGRLDNLCIIGSDETSTTQAAEQTDICPEVHRRLTLEKQNDTGGGCVSRGGTISYTLSYDNTPNSIDVHDVTLTDHLPIQVEFLSCSGPGVYNEVGHEVTWQIGTLAAGEAGEEEVVGKVNSIIAGGTEICNRAEITASDTPATEVTDCTQVCVDLMSVQIAKTGLTDGTCADRGDTIRYLVDYENPNPVDLSGVCLTDYLPDGTDFLSASPGGIYEPAERTVTWEVGPLPAGEEGGVELLALVRPDATPGATVTNRCEAAAEGVSVSTAQAATHICSLAPLGLAKTDGRDGQCVSRGTHMTYAISYDNAANPGDVEAVVLTDYLSSLVVFESATGGGVYHTASHRVTWDLGTLAGEARDTVRVTVKVRSTVSSGSRIENRCEIAGTGTGVTQATSITAVCGGSPFDFKVAVHVVEHSDQRTCSNGMPTITACRDLMTTCEGYSVDAFPVFFDFEEYLGLEYGLAWCDTGTCQPAAFTSCSDLTIGDIEWTGDGISQVWLSCQTGPAVPGWAWIYANGPSLICVVPHPTSGSISVLGCAENLGTEMCNFCAGVYGQLGDDPCVPTNTIPTTWGNIKAMFR